MLLYRQRLGTIILFLSDSVIIFTIFLLAVFIRKIVPSIIPVVPIFSGNPANYYWFFLIWFATMTYEGGYSRRFTFWDEVKLLWKVTFFSTLAILTIISLGQLSYVVSRSVILLMGFLSLGIFPVMRIAVKRQLINAGMLKSRVLIIGTDETARRALSALRREPNLGYDVIGFISDEPSNKKYIIDGVKVHGYFHNVERYVRNSDIQDVVVATSRIEKDALFHLVNNLQHKAKSVLYIPDFSGMAVMGTELRHFFHDQVFALEIKNNLAQPFNYYAKKAFDYLMSIILFLVLMIPFVIISILVRVTSKGPAIFKQERVGKNGRPFMCYKFRTMYNDADDRLRTILITDPEARAEWQAYWKLKNDPRITKIGNFLRKTSLDELPQIFNVLRGEMSLVGPRPVTQHEIEMYYKDKAKLCFCVPPGITGLWQVSGRSNTSYEYRVSLDSWYVRNWNLWLDIVILMKTFYVVLKREGAQ
jgi:Undecaprenyl-phosphate galactose phosphotransferase WbaP